MANDRINWWEDFEVEGLSQEKDVWAAFEVPQEPTPQRVPSGMWQSGSELGPRGMAQRGQQRLEERRERRLSAAQEISEILGAPVDPEGNFQSGGGDWFLSWNMGRSRDFNSQRQKFLNAYPEGDIRSVHTESGVTMVARRDPSEPYRVVSRAGEIASAVISEPSIFGAVGSFAGPWGTALGVGVGEILQRSWERAAGYEQDRSNAQNASAAAIEGAIAGGLDVATRRMFRVIGIAPRQADVVSVLEAQNRLSAKAIEELGVKFPELLQGQVGGPFVRGMFLQAGATTGRVEQAIGRQSRDLYNWFQANIDAVPVAALDDGTLGLIARNYRAELSKLTDLGAVNRTDAGELLGQGVRVWRETTRELRNRAYEDAGRLSDGVVFDISPAQARVQELRQGVFGRGRAVEVESPILGPSGRPMTQEVTPDIRLPEGQHRELSQIMDAISELDPQVGRHVTTGGVESSGLEQIARLRSRLFRLKEEPMIDSDVYRQANDLWSTLTEIMDAPVGGSPEFVEAFRAARTLHRDMEEVLKITQVKNLLRGNNITPEGAAAKFTNPNHATELRVFKDLLEPDQWNSFRELMVNDLINGSPTPQAALSRIRRIEAQDSQMLRMFMSEGEQASFESLLQQRVIMESQPFIEAMRRFSFEADRAGHIFTSSTPAELSDFVARAGGVNSEAAAALRGHVYSDLFNYAREADRQFGPVVSARRLQSRLNELEKTGKLRVVFSDKDFDMLRDLELFSVALSDVADVGGGMMAGAARQKGIQAFADLLSNRTGRITSLAQQLLSNDATAFMLSRPAIRTAYQPMPETLEGRLRRWALYSQLAVREALGEPELEDELQQGGLQ